MKLIEQKVENISQTDFTYDGIMKYVEKIGRICYGSIDKITENSWKSFTEMLRRNRHFSPFGHATAYFYSSRLTNKEIDICNIQTDKSYKGSLLNFFSKNDLRTRFKTVESSGVETDIVAVSVRIIEEWNLWSILKPLLCTEITSKFPQRISLLCTTSIAMSRELNRHSFNLDIMEKSTRYTLCDTIIKPHWWKNCIEITDDDEFKSLTSRDEDKIQRLREVNFLYTCRDSMNHYNKLIGLDIPKQDARDVLPLATMTEVCYTAFDDQWRDVIKKRSDSGVHLQMRDLVELIKNKYSN